MTVSRYIVRNMTASFLGLGLCVANAVAGAADSASVEPLLIDDFEKTSVSGLYVGRQNQLGGYHGTWAQRPSFVRMVTDGVAPCNDVGTSLQLTYDRISGSCGWYTKLGDIDARSYNVLRFCVRGQEGGEDVRLGFSDREMLEYGVDPAYVGSISAYLPGGIRTEWRQVSVPLDAVGEKINLDQLGQIHLAFTGLRKGTIVIDDLRLEYDPHIDTQRDATLPIAKNTSTPRSLYVWDMDPVDKPEAAEQLLSFCKRTQVYHLMLDMAFLEKRVGDARYAEALGTFLSKAHLKGIDVSAMAGRPGWATLDGQREALSYVDTLLAFNGSQALSYRFDGLHLDVEVHTTAGWAQDPARMMQKYHQLISSVSTRLQEAGTGAQRINLGIAIPPVYLTVAPYAVEAVVQLVDEVVLMSYHDNMVRIVKDSSQAVELLRHSGTPLWIAAETQDLVTQLRGRGSQTFYEEGWEQMEDTLLEVEAYFSEEELFAGLAIHHYDSYRFMKRLREGEIQ